MKTFVFLLINLFCLNSYSGELNFIKLYGLRDQHSFGDHERGKTTLEINTSKRFHDLYDSLKSEEIEEIDNGVESAYNYPYFAKALLSQSIIFNDYIIELKAQDFLIAEVNNPVFPELNLFNVRADNFSIQKHIKYKKVDVTTKLTYMNRWYIDKIYSLEEIVTNDTKFNFKNSKTFTPIYFDIKLEKDLENILYRIKGIGIELTSNDKYDYYEISTELEKEVSKNLNVTLGVSPFYMGNYSLLDNTSIGTKYRFMENFIIEGSFSKMISKLSLDTYWKSIFVSCKILNIRKSYFEEKYVNNFSVTLGLQY